MLRQEHFAKISTRFGVSEATPDLLRGKRSNPELVSGLSVSFGGGKTTALFF